MGEDLDDIFGDEDEESGGDDMDLGDMDASGDDAGDDASGGDMDLGDMDAAGDDASDDAGEGGEDIDLGDMDASGDDAGDDASGGDMDLGDLAEAFADGDDAAGEGGGAPAGGDSIKTSRASLNKVEAVNLDFLLDIKLDATFEVGRSQMMISDLLTLGQGSVVELHRLVGEELDVLVNGKLIAKGEVVVVNEKFGCRISEIIAPEDRIKHLANFGP